MLTSTLRACIAAAVLAAVSVAPAEAQSFTGTTVGGPTWNRTVGGFPPTPPVSGVGTAVRYQTLTFTVDVSGSYNFLNTATAPSGWDNYSHLYVNSFDPLNQFTNVLVANDDFPTPGVSGFNNIGLTAGWNYIFVASGFGNTDAGAFRLDISGPGTATLVNSNVVPEPSTYALLATGLVGLSAVARRRRREA